jgi:hypothetical protein
MNDTTSKNKRVFPERIDPETLAWAQEWMSKKGEFIRQTAKDGSPLARNVAQFILNITGNGEAKKVS